MTHSLCNSLMFALAAAAAHLSYPIPTARGAQPERAAPAVDTGETSDHHATVPDWLQDLPFDRYADPKLLGKAMNRLDAALLTDFAIQLAEGERLLMRPRKALDAAEVHRLAVRLAEETRDKDSLDRLARHAKRTGDAPLGKMAEAAAARVAAAPPPPPLFRVDPTECTAAQLGFARDAVRDLRAAKLTRDADAAARLAERVEAAGEEHLSAAQKVALLDLVRAAGRELGGAKPTEGEKRLAEAVVALQRIANPYPYAVVGLWNPTAQSIKYQFRWGNGVWKSWQIEPGQRRWHAWTFNNPNQQVWPAPQIRFDSELIPGGLNWTVMQLHANPASRQGYWYGNRYAFSIADGHRIVLGRVFDDPAPDAVQP